MSQLILVVEDEEDLVTSLEYRLQMEGYETRIAMTGEDAVRMAHEEPLPNLILLDLMLPDMSGKEVCRQVRASAVTKHMPVVMLTARGEEVDRIVGLELGADDYVVKPCSMRELMLRIQAVLRRFQEPAPAVSDTSEPERVQYGCLSVDKEAHRAWVDDEEIALTALEFRLLVTFVERRGRTQSRSQLLTDVWGYHADVTTRTVDTHVKRLREKMGRASEYLETVRGVGYRFEAPASESRS